MRNGIHEGHRLARSHALAEGLGLDGHGVGHLDGIVIVLRAVLIRLAAVRGVTDNRTIGGTGEAEHLGAGIRAGVDAGRRRGNVLGRGNAHGHLDGLRGIGRIDVIGILHGAFDSKGLCLELCGVKALDALPLNVDQIGLAAGEGQADLFCKAPVALGARVLSGLRDHGISKGNVHVIELIHLLVHVLARLGEQGVQILGAVLLRDPCGVLGCFLPIHPEVQVIGHGVLHARGSAPRLQLQRRRVTREMLGRTRLVARRRPGDRRRTAGALGEVLGNIGPGVPAAGLDPHGRCALGEDLMGRRSRDLEIHRGDDRRIDSRDLAVVVSREVLDLERLLREIGAFRGIRPLPVVEVSTVLAGGRDRDGPADIASHVDLIGPARVALTVKRGV